MANRIRKAIIKANRAMASVRANPRIQILKRSSDRSGFLETPMMNAPKTRPIPAPAPASPVVDSPAPISLAGP